MGWHARGSDTTQNYPVMNSQYYFVNTPIYTSRRVERVAVGRRECQMSYGDRISVRVNAGGRNLLEYETRSVADMTDLTGDLRRRTRGQRGLVVLTIRNHDRGWVREHRIMLYPEGTYAPSPRVAEARRRPIMPWEH